MGSSCVLHPIMGALVALEKLIGGPRVWSPINKEQERFLRHFGTDLGVGRKESELLKALEGVTLKTKAAKSADVLREFLAAEGFNLPVRDFKPDEAGAAAVLKILLKWLAAGERLEIIGERTGGRYPAFKITRSRKLDNVAFFKARGPVAMLRTKSGIRVHVTPLNEELAGLDLLEWAIDISQALHSGGEYDGVVIPMVSMDHEVDITWLQGMWTLGQFVAQALQQTRLRMNHLGALAESAAVVTTRKALSETLTIKGPFVLWMEVDGFSQPLFTAHITEEDWKDPGPIPGLEDPEKSKK